MESCWESDEPVEYVVADVATLAATAEIMACWDASVSLAKLKDVSAWVLITVTYFTTASTMDAVDSLQ